MTVMITTITKALVALVVRAGLDVAIQPADPATPLHDTVSRDDHQPAVALIVLDIEDPGALKLWYARIGTEVDTGTGLVVISDIWAGGINHALGTLGGERVGNATFTFNVDDHHVKSLRNSFRDGQL
jgi:hypothetical protein